MLEAFEKSDELRRLLNGEWQDKIRAILNSGS
jgi:hypothetical protein